MSAITSAEWVMITTYLLRMGKKNKRKYDVVGLNNLILKDSKRLKHCLAIYQDKRSGLWSIFTREDIMTQLQDLGYTDIKIRERKNYFVYEVDKR